MLPFAVLVLLGVSLSFVRLTLGSVRLTALHLHVRLALRHGLTLHVPLTVR